MAIKLEIELLKNTEVIEKTLAFDLESYVNFNYSMNHFGMVFKLSNNQIEKINNSQINLINNAIQTASSKETYSLKIRLSVNQDIVLETSPLKTVAYDINNDSGSVLETLRFV